MAASGLRGGFRYSADSGAVKIGFGEVEDVLRRVFSFKRVQVKRQE